MAAHRYWRVNVTANNTSGTVSIGEIELRSSLGGADQTGSGTASASSANASFPVTNVFDNNVNTRWVSTGNVPQWVKYDFGSGNDKDIVELSLCPGLGTSSGTKQQWPVDFQLQYSDDDSAWTTLFSVAGETTWNPQVAQVFNADSIPNDSGVSGWFWRVRATAVDGGSVFGLAEVMMYEAAGVNVCTPNASGIGVIFSSTCLESTDTEAFDGILADTTLGSYWTTMASTGWIGYKFASAKTIVTIGISARIENHNQSPKNFVVEYWNGSSYVTAMTLTNITGWTSGQERWFNASGETTEPVATASARPIVFVP